MAARGQIGPQNSGDRCRRRSRPIPWLSPLLPVRFPRISLDARPHGNGYNPGSLTHGSRRDRTMHARIVLTLATMLAFVGIPSPASPGDKALEVTGLSCAYLKDPLGIDVTEPRLGWQIVPADAAERGVRQSAYQVLVASSVAELQADHGDLWDSGRVTSGDSLHVTYRGKPLAYGAFCHWKVRVWDQNGRQSTWRRTGRVVGGPAPPPGLEGSMDWRTSRRRIEDGSLVSEDVLVVFGSNASRGLCHIGRISRAVY